MIRRLVNQAIAYRGYDRAKQNILYRHPRLEVYGLPAFTSPFGPCLRLKSAVAFGPGFAGSSDFGTAVDIPYFFNLAPNYDGR